MSEPVDGATPSRAAWQPFTFAGVAAFARAGLGRLLLAELVTAMLAGGSVVYFLQRDCAPAILQAIQKLPESAALSHGRLAGIDTTILAQTKFFAIAVTPASSDQIGQTADVQVQFRPTDFRVGSAFRPDWGWEFGYGPEALNLSRSNLEPWWGAWHPVFLAAAGLSVVLLLCGNWAVLALIYTVPAKFVAWFADRQLSWAGAWKMNSAALLPGAFLMVAGCLLYCWRAMDLIGLASIFVAHLLVGWVYVGGGVWGCPRLYPNVLKQNPFIP